VDTTTCKVISIS